MIIIFLLILLLYELIGDSILQLDRIIFKRRIDRFNLLEHFVFSLMLGLIINTLFTFIVIYIGPFDFTLFLLCNFIFLIVILLINKGSFKGFFYWRAYKGLRNKEKSKRSWHYFRKFFFFFIGIVLLDIYINSFVIELEFVDLYNHSRFALDYIKHGWYYYGSNILFDLFVVDEIYASRIFIFTLIPFYSIAPSGWLYISGILLTKLQFYMIFTLIFIILYKFDSKFNIIIIFFVCAATMMFPSFFTYFLPTNFTIVPFLILLIFLFNENYKSLFIELLLFIFIIFIHITSILFILSIPLILTLLLNWIFDPTSLFHNYYEKKNKIIIYIKKKRWIFLFGIEIIIISSLFLIILNSSYIIDSINSYSNISNSYDVSFLPTLYVWQKLTIGLVFNIGILIGIFYLFKSKKIKRVKYLVLFFFILNLYLTIYLMDYEFWYNIINTFYCEFRLIVYLDISLLILVPVLFSIIFKKTKFLNKKEFYAKKKLLFINNYLKRFDLNVLSFYKKINHFLKRKRIELHNYITFSKLANAIIILILLFYCVIRAIPNYQERYYRDSFEDLAYKSYYITLSLLNTYAIDYQTYMIDPSFSWKITHTYLYKLRCIDLNQITPYYDDFRYKVNNSGYQDFLDFVYNTTKIIYYKQATYKYNYLRYTKRVDYIIIDNFANPKLCNLMLNDTIHFKKIFQIRYVHLNINLISLIINSRIPYIYIFEPIRNP